MAAYVKVANADNLQPSQATLVEAGGRRYAADLLVECQKINNS